MRNEFEQVAAASTAATSHLQPPMHLVIQKTPDKETRAVVRSIPFGDACLEIKDYGALASLANLLAFIKKTRMPYEIWMQIFYYVFADNVLPFFSPVAIFNAFPGEDQRQLENLRLSLCPVALRASSLENNIYYEVHSLLDAAFNADIAVVKYILSNSRHPKILLSVTGEVVVEGYPDIKRRGTALQFALRSGDIEMVELIKQYLPYQEFSKQFKSVFGSDLKAFREKQKKDADKLFEGIVAVFNEVGVIEQSDGERSAVHYARTPKIQNKLNAFKTKLIKYAKENEVHNDFILLKAYEIYQKNNGFSLSVHAYDGPWWREATRGMYVQEITRSAQAIAKITSLFRLQNYAQGIYSLARERKASARRFKLNGDLSDDLEIRVNRRYKNDIRLIIDFASMSIDGDFYYYSDDAERENGIDTGRWCGQDAAPSHLLEEIISLEEGNLLKIAEYANTPEFSVVMNLLRDAIAQNDFEKIKNLLMQNISKNKKTPMQLAAEFGCWEDVILIASTMTTDANDAARYGHALLTTARKNQSTEAALVLLNVGAPCTWCIPNGKHAGYSAIHFAILNNDLALLKVILEKHGKTAANAQHGKYITPLFLAVKADNSEAVSLLMAHGAEKSDEALLKAMLGEKYNAATTLVNAGASVFRGYVDGRYAGYCTIHFAIQNSNFYLLKVMLEKYGATVANNYIPNHGKDKTKRNGFTPLSLALEQKKSEAIVLLLMHGATPNKNEWHGVFAFLESNKISDDEKRNIAELLAREAFYQNDSMVIEKLAAYHPSSMQLDNTADNGGFFKKESVTLWRSQESTNQLTVLVSDIAKQLGVLETEIIGLSAKIKSQSHAFFSGITNYAKKNELAIKNQKKTVLREVAELITGYLETGISIDAEKRAAFNQLLKDNPHWDSGLKSKRTAQLLARANVLLPCMGKSIHAAPQGSSHCAKI
ncbi:MAG: hypothetical protein A3E82_06065 [Gammaproteobacteria bacterium RIFCSPHIGHO2_12_FULL_38_11]|nr:MAG: hypothetical protein A3E82_06065 [Gammaproteobacteria bacterium RIFCSPHIGHO2_12_FULL_38_11]